MGGLVNVVIKLNLIKCYGDVTILTKTARWCTDLFEVH